jgi:multicomponent Na+:H+ antiporter subunit D
MDYEVFTTAHVVNQLQLLLLASLAFTVLVRTGRYPPEIRSVNLDADVVYRRVLPAGWLALTRTATRFGARVGRPLRAGATRAWAAVSAPLRPAGRIAAPWSTHQMVWWLVLLLGLVLVVALR